MCVSGYILRTIAPGSSRDVSYRTFLCVALIYRGRYTFFTWVPALSRNIWYCIYVP
jgi:hypothetical protein